MPHFRIAVAPPLITITEAAIGPDVYPTLKLARAALDHAIDERLTALRVARAQVLKIREADLPKENT